MRGVTVYEVDAEIRYIRYLLRDYTGNDLELHLFGATLCCDSHPWAGRIVGMRITNLCRVCLEEVQGRLQTLGRSTRP